MLHIPIISTALWDVTPTQLWDVTSYSHLNHAVLLQFNYLRDDTSNSCNPNMWDVTRTYGILLQYSWFLWILMGGCSQRPPVSRFSKASLGFCCGFASSFNAPLSGILFAMEELRFGELWNSVAGGGWWGLGMIEIMGVYHIGISWEYHWVNGLSLIIQPPPTTFFSKSRGQPFGEIWLFSGRKWWISESNRHST